MCIIAVKVTNSSVIHSPCAVAVARPTTLPSISRTCIGNCASKNHGPGATPATVKLRPTCCFCCGVVTTTLLESGCEEGASSTEEGGVSSSAVEVAATISGEGLEEGSAMRKPVITTMPTKRTKMTVHHVFVDIIKAAIWVLTYLLYRSSRFLYSFAMTRLTLSASWRAISASEKKSPVMTCLAYWERSLSHVIGYFFSTSYAVTNFSSIGAVLQIA